MTEVKATRAVQRAKNFIYVNGLLHVVHAAQYAMGINVPSIFVKNYVLLNAIEWALRDSPNITARERYTDDTTYYLMIVASVIEYVTIQFMLYFDIIVKTDPVASDTADPTILATFAAAVLSFACFVVLSFGFEAVFDFFHYWAHRIVHMNSYLYRHYHKQHHQHKNVSTEITFHQHPVDLVITNSIPSILTCILLQQTPYQMSLYTLSKLFTYKTYIEICGHTGKHVAASSFPQCIWLPRMFNFELYTEDHDNHHVLNNCNYSKRFSLWDKVFGTYTSRKSDCEKS